MAQEIISYNNKKKKILVVCQHFWPESFRINDLCDFFVESDLDVDVLCGLPNYPKGKYYNDYGLFGKRKEAYKKIKIERVLEISRGDNSNFRIFLNYISFPFSSLFHIPKYLFRKYDKIFIYQLSPVYMALPGIIIGKLTNTEIVMYVLDLWPENLYSVLPIKNKLLRLILEKSSHWYYRKADKLITISERMRSKLLDVTRLPEKNIVYIPQSCEKIYEKDVTDKNLKERFSAGFNMVYTGNISPAQDFVTIIKAAKRLIKDGFSDIRWIIVGEGMSLEWLKSEVREEGLSNSFFFEGLRPITDITKYTTIADGLIACLVKSDLLDATIPAKVISYFAAGRPIILAMDGEAREIVNNIGCGFAGSSGDPVTLANNIAKLYLLSKEERALMGQMARKYHLSNFERNMNFTKMKDFILG